MLARYWSLLKFPWLLASFICLIAPIFIPTTRYPGTFLDDTMGTATLVMFLLSMPLSLFAAPLLMIAGTGIGFGPDSILAAYMNLLILFAVGVVQWFWIVPRLTGKAEPGLQILDLHARVPAARLGEAHISPDFPFFDAESRTPVERVIDDYSENGR